MLLNNYLQLLAICYHNNNTNNNNYHNTSTSPISLKCQAQTRNKRSFGVIINGDKLKSSLEHGTAEYLSWKRYLKQIYFEFVTKVGLYVQGTVIRS